MTHLVNTISPEVQNTGVRDGRIDSVKFWLVFLVITVHVIMRKEFTGSTACVALWNWLCLFAMPLFIFISGYYSRKKDWQAFWPSIWKLMEPLIIFQVIGLLFYVDEPLTIRSVLTPFRGIVCVTYGPFKGVTGRVARVARQNRVVVYLKGLESCITTAYIPLYYLEKVEM